MKTFLLSSFIIASAGALACPAQTYNLKLFQYTSVNGVNASGEVVGTSVGTDNEGSSVSSGFLYLNGKVTMIKSPAAGDDTGSTAIAGVNVHGEILGSYLRVDPTLVNGEFIISPSGTYTYFGNVVLSSAKSLVEAYGLNDGGVIVGTVQNERGTAPGFKLSGGVYSYFSAPGQPTTIAYGINNLGQIVGEAANLNTGQIQGFVYQNGSLTIVSYPGSTQSLLTGINDAGVAVGYYFDFTSDNFVGFTYSDGVFTDLPFSQLGSVQVLGINNLGGIYGSYILGDIFGGFFAIPVTGGGTGTVEVINLPCCIVRVPVISGSGPAEQCRHEQDIR